MLATVGAQSPVFPLYYYGIPGADNFKRPSDFSFLFLFSFSLAIVYGWKNLSLKQIQKPPLLFCFIVSALILLGFKRYPEAIIFGFFAGLGIFRPALVLYTGIMLTALFVVNKNALNRLNTNFAGLAGIAFANLDQQSIIDKINQDATDVLGVPYRIEPIPPFTSLFWFNPAMTSGLYLTQDYNPLVNVKFNTVYGATSVLGIQKRFTAFYANLEAPLPKLLGVKYVVMVASKDYLITKRHKRNLIKSISLSSILPVTMLMTLWRNVTKLRMTQIKQE